MAETVESYLQKIADVPQVTVTQQDVQRHVDTYYKLIMKSGTNANAMMTLEQGTLRLIKEKEDAEALVKELQDELMGKNQEIAQLSTQLQSLRTQQAHDAMDQHDRDRKDTRAWSKAMDDSENDGPPVYRGSSQ